MKSGMPREEPANNPPANPNPAPTSPQAPVFQITPWTLLFKSRQVEKEFCKFYFGPNFIYGKTYVTLLAVLNCLVLYYFAPHFGPRFDLFSLGLLAPYAVVASFHFAVVPMVWWKRLSPIHQFLIEFVFATHFPTYSLAHLTTHNSIPSVFLAVVCAAFCSLLGRQRFCVTIIASCIIPVCIIASVVLTGWVNRFLPPRALFVSVYFVLFETLHYMSEYSWRRIFHSQMVLEWKTNKLREEKVKSERLLRSLFPHRVIQTLADVEAPDHPVPREFRGTCILVADVVDFTRWASTAQPAEVMWFQNTFIARCDKVVNRHRAEKVHTLGDAYVAVLLPESQLLPCIAARRMLVIAMEIQREFAKIQQQVAEHLRPSGLRVGAHYGNVVGAFVGGKGCHLQYDFYGVAMAVVARLEADCEPGCVHASDTLWRLSLSAGSPLGTARAVAVVGVPEEAAFTGSSYFELHPASWMIEVGVDISTPERFGAGSAQIEMPLATRRLALLLDLEEQPYEPPKTPYHTLQFEFDSWLTLKFSSTATEISYQQFVIGNKPELAGWKLVRAIPFIVPSILIGQAVLTPFTLRNVMLMLVMCTGCLGLQFVSRRLVQPLPHFLADSTPNSDESLTVSNPENENAACTRKLSPDAARVVYTLCIVLSTIPAFFAGRSPIIEGSEELQRIIQMAALTVASVCLQFALFLPYSLRVISNFCVQGLWLLALAVSPEIYAQFSWPLGLPFYLCVSVLLVALCWALIAWFSEYCARRQFDIFCHEKRHLASTQGEHLQTLTTVLRVMLPAGVLLRMNHAVATPHNPLQSGHSDAAALTGAGIGSWVDAAITDKVDSATYLFFGITNYEELMLFHRVEAVEGTHQVLTVLDEVSRLTAVASETTDVVWVKSFGPMALIVAGAMDPKPNPEVHVAAVISLARQILAAVARLNVVKPAGQLDVEVSMGINTGPCIAGVVGTMQLIYDVFGDAVNVASRMQSLALPRTIQVTEAVCAVLGHSLFEPRTTMWVKGKGVMPLYYLRDTTSSWGARTVSIPGPSSSSSSSSSSNEGSAARAAPQLDLCPFPDPLIMPNNINIPNFL
eukprot:TRINITY_DN11220_c0_g1_i3.p1 TRINITY_DN11220_c0_g1~~TRINITY_DN11220_c0_g1_i3.p1  ORF type:complete len:1080 (+),score=160.17 TRINITY_DN11220_c0_g1_i3:33-3272(+)